MSNEREVFNSKYDAICRRSITNREIASRMFQAGAEWQRSQSAPAGFVMVSVELAERLLDEGPRRVTWAAQDELRALLAAALKAETVKEPVATVTIQHFRQDPSMENLEFQLQAPLPQGTHKLYASPVAQQKMLVPERRGIAPVHPYSMGWNACLDEFARLNGGKP